MRMAACVTLARKFFTFAAIIRSCSLRCSCTEAEPWETASRHGKSVMTGAKVVRVTRMNSQRSAPK